MLLTLVNNQYAAPPGRKTWSAPSASSSPPAASPSARTSSYRPAGDADPAGEDLAEAAGTGGAANLALAQQALEGLVDPDTRKVQRGGWLLRPFHESLLWYDARRAGPR